jgi:hypothetical protein
LVWKPVVYGNLPVLFQPVKPEATKRSGTFAVLRKGWTCSWVGVPSPLRMAKTLSCSTSLRTTVAVLVGL